MALYIGVMSGTSLDGMDIALVSLTLQTGDEQRDAANVEVFGKLIPISNSKVLLTAVRLASP